MVDSSVKFLVLLSNRQGVLHQLSGVLFFSFGEEHGYFGQEARYIVLHIDLVVVLDQALLRGHSSNHVSLSFKQVRFKLTDELPMSVAIVSPNDYGVLVAV